MSAPYIPSELADLGTPGTDYSVPGADETITGVKTHAIMTVITTDAIADPTTGTGQLQRIDMPDGGITPPFGFSIWSYPTTDPGGRQNHPFYWGHNCGKGGQPIDPTQPSCGIGMESFWVQYDAGGQFEVHLAVTQFVNGHNQIRPVSAVILRDGSYCNLLFTADALTYTTGSNVAKISVDWPEISYLDGTYLVGVTNDTPFIRQANNVGSLVNLIHIDSSNVIRVGDSGYTGVKLAFDNPLTSITLTNSGGGLQLTKANGSIANLISIDAFDQTLINCPFNCNIIVGGNGYFGLGTASNKAIRFNSGTAAGNGLVLGLTGTTDGTSKVGFHGATPLTKQTITGSRADGTALASLLTALAAKGLITDSTTA